MNLIGLTNIHFLISIFEDEDNARLHVISVLHNSTHTVGSMFNVVMLLHISKKIKAELIQS